MLAVPSKKVLRCGLEGREIVFCAFMSLYVSEAGPAIGAIWREGLHNCNVRACMLVNSVTTYRVPYATVMGNSLKGHKQCWQ